MRRFMLSGFYGFITAITQSVEMSRVPCHHKSLFRAVLPTYASEMTCFVLMDCGYFFASHVRPLCLKIKSKCAFTPAHIAENQSFGSWKLRSYIIHLSEFESASLLLWLQRLAMNIYACLIIYILLSYINVPNRQYPILENHMFTLWACRTAELVVLAPHENNLLINLPTHFNLDRSQPFNDILRNTDLSFGIGLEFKKKSA